MGATKSRGVRGCVSNPCATKVAEEGEADRWLVRVYNEVSFLLFLAFAKCQLTANESYYRVFELDNTQPFIKP